MVMPGSHKVFLQGIGDRDATENYKKGGASTGAGLDVTELRRMATEGGIEHCEGKAGDVVFFDCNVMHGRVTTLRGVGIVLGPVGNSTWLVTLQTPPLLPCFPYH